MASAQRTVWSMAPGRSKGPQSVGPARSRNRPQTARVSGAARHVPTVVTALGARMVARRPTAAWATRCRGNSITGMRRQRELRLTRREAATLTRATGIGEAVPMRWLDSGRRGGPDGVDEVQLLVHCELHEAWGCFLACRSKRRGSR
jgi:hypothetical protein